MSTIKSPVHSSIDELVLCLSMALDLDEDTKLYHCWHVAVIADKMAEMLSLKTRPYVFFAGLFHDIGGIGAPMHVMHYMAKNGKAVDLVSEVELHPFLGAQAIRIIPGLNHRHYIADIVLQHHEHADGSGFPNGLNEQEILLEAALIHAADMFDIYNHSDEGVPDVDALLQKMQKDSRVSPVAVDALQMALQISDLLSVLRDEAELAVCVRNLYNEHRTSLKDNTDEETVLEGMLSLVSMMIDRKHSYTQGHSARVAAYSAEIARSLGFPETDVKTLLQAGLVHDVGKLSVPRAVLDKRGKLDGEQWVTMQRHAKLSWDILCAFPLLEKYSFSALHHERWDGHGYPFGLAGVTIPIFGRIMAVADALDAMTSHRPYRKIWSFGRAIQEIQRGAGTQFDPNIAAMAAKLFSSDCVIQR